MPVVRALRSIPLEVYPIFGMMSCALAFGGFVATRKTLFDRDLRVRADRGYQKDHWLDRLNGRL
ncbi:hypothetical protein DFJ73DRAFT_812948 [Zopfochytrium polystomum]|nr:hypothetical protein DFJ73DRAFT_631588 [Zopfochytrium polystomum]KAI9359920.1 hypothetical protein DFJ73DRAFT_816034 [Zopfochytrium polystomum]KAI9359922.1 hypothetical protein DFJ73DRAFT_816041 [Zopfochytrium polystomum]KAI9362012.1 hypothetical protein DFJ73DRAFT_812948 [Zopfochytrium polystomum]